MRSLASANTKPRKNYYATHSNCFSLNSQVSRIYITTSQNEFFPAYLEHPHLLVPEYDPPPLLGPHPLHPAVLHEPVGLEHSAHVHVVVVALEVVPLVAINT